MRLLSKRWGYAMRAVLFLASREDAEQFIPVRIIADELNLSSQFLTKILQTLTIYGIVMTYRGPNGGVALARPARDISLWDVVVAIDGEDFYKGCLFNFPECVENEHCVLHTPWRNVASRIRKVFQHTSFATLSKRNHQAKSP